VTGAGGRPRGRAKAAAPELEREISRTRSRIGVSFDELAKRFGPRRLLEKGLEMASRFLAPENRARSEDGGGFRPDPIAIGLIAAGIVWLAVQSIGRRRRPQTGAPADGETDGLRDGQISVSAGVAAEPSEEHQRRWDGLVDSNPLLIGVLGLAAGAALAALLPPGRGEQNLLAGAREGLWRQAEGLGHQTAARLHDLGRGPAAAPAERGSAE
jgi:Protein of unknown function (DUF3618)